jgi:uncharacterized protein (TIGR03435 family)
MTSRELIANAYGSPSFPPKPLPNYRVVGGPDWIDTLRFDIEARAASDVPRSTAGIGQKLLMLRTTLAERFRLVMHGETREGPIYALTMSRLDGQFGPQLQQSQLDCAANRNVGRPSPPPGSPAAGGIRTCGYAANLLLGTAIGGGATMTELAYLLSTVVDRVVVDRTGLTGEFDFDLQFGLEGLREVPEARDVDRQLDDSPSLFIALQEQLGLRLAETEGSVDVLVIDSVERPEPD